MHCHHCSCATGVNIAFEGVDLNSAAFTTASQVKKLTSYSVLSLYFQAKAAFFDVVRRRVIRRCLLRAYHGCSPARAAGCSRGGHSMLHSGVPASVAMPCHSRNHYDSQLCILGVCQNTCQLLLAVHAISSLPVAQQTAAQLEVLIKVYLQQSTSQWVLIDPVYPGWMPGCESRGGQLYPNTGSACIICSYMTSTALTTAAIWPAGGLVHSQGRRVLGQLWRCAAEHSGCVQRQCCSQYGRSFKWKHWTLNQPGLQIKRGALTTSKQH